jgi:hypothetical protein
MPVRTLAAAVAAACLAAGAGAQQLPPLTEAEALGLIDLTVDEIAERLEARVNAGVPGETGLSEALDAWHAFVAGSMAALRDKHGAAAGNLSINQFETDIDRWWRNGYLPDEPGLTYEAFVAAADDMVDVFTSDEALAHIDSILASLPAPVSLDPADPVSWSTSNLARFPGGFESSHLLFPGILGRAIRDAAATDDRAASLANTRRLTTLANEFSGRPRTLLDGLIYSAWVSTLATECMRPVIASGALDSAACRELRQLLGDLDCAVVGRTASDAELYFAAAMIRKNFVGSHALIDQMIRDDWRLLVDHWASVTPAFEMPIGQGDHWQASAAFSDELDERAGAIAGVLTPARRSAAFNMQVAQLEVEASIIMLALEEHRLDHGAHPETLDALVPRYLDAVPIDPLTGEQFRYIRSIEGDAAPTTGYTLYSIGSDMNDDGGVVDPDYRSTGLSDRIPISEPYDHIFNRPYPLPGDPGAR